MLATWWVAQHSPSTHINDFFLKTGREGIARMPKKGKGNSMIYIELEGFLRKHSRVKIFFGRCGKRWVKRPSLFQAHRLSKFHVEIFEISKKPLYSQI
jgi:hypothetical protein